MLQIRAIKLAAALKSGCFNLWIWCESGSFLSEKFTISLCFCSLVAVLYSVLIKRVNIRAFC